MDWTTLLTEDQIAKLTTLNERSDRRAAWEAIYDTMNNAKRLLNRAANMEGVDSNALHKIEEQVDELQVAVHKAIANVKPNDDGSVDPIGQW